MTVVRHTFDPLEKYNAYYKARKFHGYSSGSAERAHSCGLEALQPHRLQDYVRRSTALRGADMGAWLHVEVAAGHERDALHVSFHQGPASPPHWTGQCITCWTCDEVLRGQEQCGIHDPDHGVPLRTSHGHPHS